jgi:hypothetical protein
MAITRFSMYKSRLRYERKLMKRLRLNKKRYNYKKYKKYNTQTPLTKYIENEMKDMLESDLYELVGQIAHVRQYIQNMQFEYCGEAAEEMEVYLYTIDDIYHRASKHHREASYNERDIYPRHLKEYKEEYEAFMDEAGLIYDEVYDYLFEIADDGGYQTPPPPSSKKIKQIMETYDELEKITEGIICLGV